MKSPFQLLLVAALLGAFSLFADEPASPLYSFKQGESYVYQIRIETQEASYTGVLNGIMTYTARTVNPHGFTLRTSGSLHPSRKMKDGRAFPPFGVYRVGLQYFDNSPAMGFPFRQPRDVVFDIKGSIIQQGDAAPQPMQFDLTSFIIEPLSAKGDAKWEFTNPTVVVHEELESVEPGGISRLVRIKKNNLVATEKISYSLMPGTNAATVIIKKQLEVKTRQMVGDSPRIQTAGEGEIVFDTKLGVPRSMEFKQTLTEAEENLTRKTPMTLTYKLLEGKEREAALVALASTNRLATSTNRPPAKLTPPKAEAKPLTDIERTQILADLKSARTFTKRSAANRLAEAAVTRKHCDEVLKALAPLLADADLFTRAAAVKTLGTWGNRDSVTALIKMMDDPEFSVRWAVFDALAALQDQRAIEPLAKFLATGKDNHRATQSLRSFGAAAEESVTKLLAETNVSTQREAAQLLQDIGTKKSLRDLEKLLLAADPSVKFALENAIKAIQERESPAKDAKK